MFVTWLREGKYGGKIMSERREKNLQYMKRTRWHNIRQMSQFIRSRRKVERTGKAENVGMTLIFQDFLK